jgi:excisionase family DNA binding protein
VASAADKSRGEAARERAAGEEPAPFLWFSVAEIADTLNVTQACIRRWCRLGIIGSVRIGKYRRIEFGEIKRLARESKLPSITLAPMRR